MRCKWQIENSTWRINPKILYSPKRTHVYTHLPCNFHKSTMLAGLCNLCDDFGHANLCALLHTLFPKLKQQQLMVMVLLRGYEHIKHFSRQSWQNHLKGIPHANNCARVMHLDLAQKSILITVRKLLTSTMYKIASAADELKEGLPSSQPSTAQSLGTREFT